MENGTTEVAPTTGKPDKKARGTVVRNPELVALQKITNLLDGDGMTDASRLFVINYINEKYNS